MTEATTFRPSTCLFYCGPVIYENESDGTPTWHFYATDHPGNVRVVSDVWGRAEQINHYYPYGLTFADAGKGADVQPCKHGGKELDAMYGLYWSDFGARHLSPYLYCANNPFNFIDPDGRDYYGVDNLGSFSLISVNDDLTDRIFKLDQNRKPLGDTFVDVEKDFMSSLYGEDVKLDSEISIA